jgi:hypothetical protein
MKIVSVNPPSTTLPRRATPMRVPINIPKAKPVEPSGTYTLAKRGRNVKREPAP